MTDKLKWKLANLPESPGCYIMKSQGEVIYVGKAVNLKNRVRQYFQSSRGHTAKVSAMVARIDDFDTVLVTGELEALILECNLIKRYRPFYNILLKDDKQYPYIAIDMNEPFPRVRLKRRYEKDGLRYFGPYKSASVVREVMDVVRQVFPIRSCERDIQPGSAMRPCVHHATGDCQAPCAGLISREDYRKTVDKVIEFLSGKYELVLDEMKARMLEASGSMNYERAAVYRDRIEAVKTVMQRQRAAHAGGGDQDVLACAPEGPDALVECLSIRDGKLIDSNLYTFQHSGDEKAGEVLTNFILQHYDAVSGIPREILLSSDIEDMDVLSQLMTETAGYKVSIHAPKRGDKKKLVEIAEKNLSDAIEKRAMRMEKSFSRTIGACAELARELGLAERPRRIEGYDISNTQGVLSVGSMVVMIDGELAKKQYRHFRIKSVEGSNDFASMYEVILRRLTHGVAEKEKREAEGLDPKEGSFSDMPDLILIDGGAGQLNAAISAMSETGLAIPMFGLAKRLEEIVLPGSERTLLLDRHSEALHLIQRLRDEAHRFGITHHRQLRAKRSIASSLDGIPGIGAKKKKALLKSFKTIEAIKSASVEQLCQAEGIGEALAKVIREHFGNSD
ncbi:MAG: excinuclease ABC subunit UvrC [Clostridia bacterium]|nr:excinuclease ABC subunit UvrC [Clostridia bacterium]